MLAKENEYMQEVVRSLYVANVDENKIEFLTDLCSWCNANEGVVSALLTILTIIISVIALFVSIKLGKIPYRKALTAIPFYQEKDGEPTIDITLVNYGMCAILIKEIRILDKKKNLVGSYFATRPKVIKPSRSKSILLRLCDSDGLIRKHDLDLNGNMIIEVREYDGKVYRFKKGFPVG